MFYTINLSPLLVTKKGFMLIIILSNYPIVSTAFKYMHNMIEYFKRLLHKYKVNIF